MGQRLREDWSPRRSPDVTAFLPLPLLSSKAAEHAAATLWFTVAPRGDKIKPNFLQFLSLFLEIYEEYGDAGATA